MTDLITTLVTGSAVFIATNIDDFFILILLFTQVNGLLRRRHIVMGQYLGFSFLLLVSILGVVGNYLIPNKWIRLLGLVPIMIGLNFLGKNEDSNDSEDKIFLDIFSDKTELHQPLLSPQTYGVAAITIANGGDNISVYLPLFANMALSRLPVLIGVFLLLAGAWCLVAYYLAKLPAIASLMRNYGTTFTPCILIGLGVFIVKDNWLLTLVSFGASYLWLIFFKSKESDISITENSPE